jgi:hypothetical protein
MHVIIAIPRQREVTAVTKLRFSGGAGEGTSQKAGLLRERAGTRKFRYWPLSILMVPFEFDGGPFLPCAKLTFRLRYWDRADGLEPLMRIANQCQQRALVLLQIARDCPEIRDQAVYLAREWLEVAAVRLYCLDQIERIEKEDRAD